MLANHRVLLACIVVVFSLLIHGCGKQVSGGEQTVFDSSVALGATLRVNSATGSDSSDGINVPYQSLQHALDQLKPGDVLIVEDGTYSTTDFIGEERDENDVLVRTLQGFKLSVSGSPNLPIVIEGQSGFRPVIDQQQTASNPASTLNPAIAVLGLYLDCVSYVTVRNLEIRNANEAGISSATDGACETTNVTIEDNYIHDIYGEKYVGGIRMMGVSDLTIRDNEVNNVFSNLSSEDKVLFRNGRGLSNILIENNKLSLLGNDSAVIVNAQGLGNSTFSLNQQESVSGLKIVKNEFDSVGNGISLQMQVSDSSATDELKTGMYRDVDIYGNTFNQLESALVVAAGETEHQSQKICMFNNTLIDTASPAVDISGVSDLEVFNNIYTMPQSELLVTRSPVNTSLLNTLAYNDNNVYWNFVTLSWRLDAGGIADASYPDLVTWQSSLGHPEVSSNPDLASLTIDPEFVDPLMGDYRLSPTSPALLSGRYGFSMGADFTLSAGFESDCEPSP